MLNFLCSAEDVGLDLKTVVVFVGSPQDAVLVENMGAQALYSTALGSMPAKAAAAYLDHTFSRMMWFKTTSIFLATSCGFDALFQGVGFVPPSPPCYSPPTLPHMRCRPPIVFLQTWTWCGRRTRWDTSRSVLSCIPAPPPLPHPS